MINDENRNTHVDGGITTDFLLCSIHDVAAEKSSGHVVTLPLAQAAGVWVTKWDMEDKNYRRLTWGIREWVDTQ